LTQVQKTKASMQQMEEALKNQEEKFAEMVNKNESLKAVWRAMGDGQQGATFIQQSTSKTISSQTTTQQVHSDTQETSVSTSVSASFCGFGGGVSAGVSHSDGQDQMQGDQEVKEDKFHFECEGDFGELENPLLGKVLEALQNDKWCPKEEEKKEGLDAEENQKGPGYLWKVPPGKNARFYVKEIFFARKLVMFTSNLEASGQIQSATTRSSTAFNAGVSGTAYGVTAAVDVSHGQSTADTNTKSSMKKNAKDNSYSHGDLYIKFLLLKAITPGPKRSQDTKTDEVDTVDYAKQHLGA